MTRRPPAARRPGFTLVELLLVITIIGILTGLLLGVVRRAQLAGLRTQTASDISQLNAALFRFKQDFGFYPPPTFTVPTTSSDPNLPPIQRMFPRWNPNPSGSATPVPLTFGLFSGTLDSNQCLVFFLAGPGLQGWDASNPTNATPSSVANRKGPYFEVPTNRLDNTTANPHFLDPWRTPYAYLQSGSTTPPQPTGGSSSGGPVAVSVTTASGVQNIIPYSTPLGTGTAQFAKPVNVDGVQLVSAGPNKMFGPGFSTTTTGTTVYRVWVPNTPPDYSSNDPTSAGSDDYANFNNGAPLGVDASK